MSKCQNVKKSFGGNRCFETRNRNVIPRHLATRHDPWESIVFPGGLVGEKPGKKSRGFLYSMNYHVFAHKKKETGRDSRWGIFWSLNFWLTNIWTHPKEGRNMWTISSSNGQKAANATSSGCFPANEPMWCSKGVETICHCSQQPKENNQLACEKQKMIDITRKHLRSCELNWRAIH